MLERIRAERLRWPAPSFFQSRKLLCCALLFVAGIMASRVLPYSAWLYGAAALLLVFALLCRRERRLLLPLAALSLVAFGVARGGMELAVPEMPEFGTWEAVGRINGAIKPGANGVTFFLYDVKVKPEGADAFVDVDSNLYVYTTATPREKLVNGQMVTISGTSYEPTIRRNPGGFDQKSWLAQQGAHARMYAKAVPRAMEQASFTVKGAAIAVRDWLSARMDALFGSASPVVRAMLLGDQSDVPSEWKQSMQRAGIAHILSVSGLHVGLWFLMLQWLLKPVPVSPRMRFVLLTFLLFGYALLTGLNPPVLRATLMLLFVQGARMAKRKVDPLTSLAVAASIILAFRPLDLFAAGFQLSFCAVLGMVLLRPQLAKIIRFEPEFISASLATTLAAQVGILPAELHWFGYMSVVGFFVNLVAVPLAGFLIPTAVIALLLHGIWPPLAYLPVQAARGLVAEIVWLSGVAADLSFSTLRIGAASIATIAACFACLLLCSSAVVWRWRTRFIAMGLCGAFALGAGVLHGDFAVRYVQLDVGQGLSGVLHTGYSAFVFDCGEDRSDLADYLMYTGARVEGLFLSHPHTDHTGGITSVLENRIHIDTLYVPANADAFGAEPGYQERLARAEANGTRIAPVAAGDVLSLHGLKATVIAPPREPARGSDPNDRSIVLLVEIGDKSLLLCADADGAAEPLGVDCDVLQVAHHGSARAAGEGFLRDATPDVALLSYGRNYYGHPNPDTVKRLEDAGADVYGTLESGAITVRFGGKLRVEEYIK